MTTPEPERAGTLPPPPLSPQTETALAHTGLRRSLAEAKGLGPRLAALGNWFNATRIGRANARMGTTQGNLLAGGVAYAALFSIFSALTVGVTAVMTVLGSRPEWRDAVLSAIGEAVPGILDTGNGGLVTPESLVVESFWNPVTIVSLLVALWSSLSMTGSLRTSLRAMFGIVSPPENFLMQKVRDLGGFVVLGLAVILSTVLALAASSLGGDILSAIGLSGPVAQVLTRAGGIVVAIAVNFGLFVFLLRGLAGVRPPRRDLMVGSLIGAIAATLLQNVGTSLVSVPDNAVMASATALVTLLLITNLAVRLALMIAAYTANPPAPLRATSPQEVRWHDEPNYVTLSEPDTLAWGYDPSDGSIIPDATLNPDYTPPARPEPKWGGLIGRLGRRRIERLERRLAAARDKYYA